MHQGRIVETGDRTSVYRNPSHAYSRALRAAVPVPDPDRRRNSGPAPDRRLHRVRRQQQPTRSNSPPSVTDRWDAAPASRRSGLRTFVVHSLPALIRERRMGNEADDPDLHRP